MLTGKQLSGYCEKVYKTAWVYWYGSCGYKCTQSLYNSKKKQYPSHYTAARTSGYERDIKAGKWCADCVGMIKSFFWTGGVFEGDNHYASNNCPDKSADGMFALCVEKGKIVTIPDIPGLVVHKKGHIGVYVGGGYTVEMKGFDYDCQRNKVKDGPWTEWGKLPENMISYGDDCDGCIIPPEPEGQRNLRNGDEGADVKQLQENLIRLGFSCGKWGADGEFGDCTEQAVEAFQRACGLNDTGVFDGNTREVMDDALDRLDATVEEPRYVKIVGGNCYVRSAPNTSGRKLGVAHEGDILTYQGQTSADGWHLVKYKNQNGWVSGKYSRLIDGGGEKRGEKIVDLSKYQPTIDYDALIADTVLIILRAGYRSKDGNIYEDQKFQLHAGELTKRGVRFGVYFYSFAGRMKDAQEEARMFWRYARDYNPLFWAVDVEQDCITNEAIKAFQHELRAMGALKVGAYVANHLYKKYDFDSVKSLFDFVWIPRYSAIRPAHPCDLWQYTSHGRVAGINEDVDLNRITGEGHDIAWFIEG